MIQQHKRNQSDAPSMSAHRNRVACAVGGLVFGFGLWASAPWLVGTREPWDADAPFYYSGLMLLGGAALGAAFPRQSGAALVGLWAGQVIAYLVLPGHDRAWAYLGVVTTGIGSLLGLGGYLAGSLLRLLLTSDSTEPADLGSTPIRSSAAWMRYTRSAVVRLCWLPVALRAASAVAGRVGGRGWDAIGSEFVLLCLSIGLSATLALAGITVLERTQRGTGFDRPLAVSTLIAGSVLLLALAV